MAAAQRMVVHTKILEWPGVHTLPQVKVADKAKLDEFRKGFTKLLEKTNCRPSNLHRQTLKNLCLPCICNSAMLALVTLYL